MRRRATATEILLIARGTEAAALALHRFGFGPSSRSVGYSIAAVAADPRGALLAELERPRASFRRQRTLALERRSRARGV